MCSEERPLAEAGRADQDHREQRVDEVDPCGEVAERPAREPDDADGERLRDDDGNDDREALVGAGETPDAAVQARRNEAEVPREQDRGQGDEEDVLLVVGARAMDEEQVSNRERRRDQGEVDDELDEAPGREENATYQHRPARRRFAGLVDVCQEAGELDEECKGHEHADKRHPAVVEAAVGKARRSEPGGDCREQYDGSLFGDAAAHEAVRRVVTAPLADGPPFDEADGGDERRVKERHGEHEQRQDQRRDRRLRHLPARQQAE